MTTSEPASTGGGEEIPGQLSIWSAEGSPASPSLSPGNASRRRTLVGSGPRSTVSFARYDPVTCSWRTSQGSLLPEWETFSGTWPVSGMTRSGTAYRQPSSVPPIYADESSLLLPTPSAAEYGSNQSSSPGAVVRPSLSTMARRVSWPTPRAQNGEPRNHKVWRRPDGQPQNLENAVAVRDPSAIGGPLNPTWVEWLMGFPLGWTDLEPSETPSSPKSPNTSGG